MIKIRNNPDREDYHSGGKEKIMKKVIFEKIESLNFQTSEAFKTFRTNILFCGEKIKVVTFTSCLPN